jgi:hypothetical protein
MRTAAPPTRLRDFPVGSKVILAGVERQLVVSEIRSDGYIELNYGAHLSVTASPGHLAEAV